MTVGAFDGDTIDIDGVNLCGLGMVEPDDGTCTVHLGFWCARFVVEATNLDDDAAAALRGREPRQAKVENRRSGEQGSCRHFTGHAMMIPRLKENPHENALSLDSQNKNHSASRAPAMLRSQ